MFKMLKKWFGKLEDVGEEHLEKFNRLVHEAWQSPGSGCKPRRGWLLKFSEVSVGKRYL